MAVNMAKITDLGGNKWQVLPDSDANDRDNIAYVLSAAAAATKSTGVKADVQLMAGTFYLKSEIRQPGFKGTLRGIAVDESIFDADLSESEEDAAFATRIVAGQSDGTLYPRRTEEERRPGGWNPHPNMLTFYSDLEYKGVDLLLTDLCFNVPGDLDDYPGDRSFWQYGPAMDNVAVFAAVQLLGRVWTESKFGQVKSLTASGSTMTLVQVTGSSGEGVFSAGDVGKTVTVRRAPESEDNDGKFTILSVPNSYTCTYTNALGSTNTAHYGNLIVNEPEYYEVEKAKLVARRCKVAGELTSAPHAEYDQKMTSLGGGFTVHGMESMMQSIIDWDGLVAAPLLGGAWYDGTTGDHTGRLYWFFNDGSANFVMFPVNSSIDVQKCYFARMGIATVGAYHSLGQYQDSELGANRSVPGKPGLRMATNLTRNDQNVSHNKFKDCGIENWSGNNGIGLVVWDDADGTYVCEHNTAITTIPLSPFNGIIDGFMVNYLDWEIPFATLLGTNTYYPAGWRKTDNNVYIRHNKFKHETDANEVFAFIYAFNFYGETSVISYNEFQSPTADWGAVIALEDYSFDSNIISYNKFYDDTTQDFFPVWGYGDNLVIEKNRGFTNQKHNIQLLEPACNCIIEGAGSVTNVLDFGTGNVVKKAKVSRSLADKKPAHAKLDKTKLAGRNPKRDKIYQQ